MKINYAIHAGRCTGLARVSYSTALMGEEEHGGRQAGRQAGWLAGWLA